MWVGAVRTLPVANQELLAAIESYHLRLKPKLFADSHAGSWVRVDWLVHILTAEFHSLYWFDQYIEESGFFQNLKQEPFSTNSWCRALNIPDVDVILDEQDLRFAKVVSQSDRNIASTIWNPGSEFSLCDCAWSRLGNLCKHVIKVGIVCRIRHVVRPSLAAQSYHHILLSLLQNPPDDPIVLDHAVLIAARMQQDIKGLEELSNSGLLLPVPSFEMDAPIVNNLLPQSCMSIDVPAKVKMRRISSPRMNITEQLVEFSGQVSPVVNSQALTNSRMREVLHLLKLPQGSNHRNIFNEQTVIDNRGIEHDI